MDFTVPKKILYLSKKTNLDNSLQTEQYILSLNGASKYKSTLLMSYFHYCKSNGINWTTPKLKCQSIPIVVPSEERIDKIMGRCTLKDIAIFQISKHGLRPDEVSKITLRDIDLQRGLLTVRTSKLGEARTIKLKEIAIMNFRAYIQFKNITDLNVRLFPKPDKLRQKWNR